MRYLWTLGLLSLAWPVWAQADRVDYDLDDNGLIEINDLADLDAIRNALDGKSLHGSSAGCPTAGCRGFELKASLDFDTHQDGKMDKQDAYWNNGKGWSPIGTKALPFSAEFEGNGHQIRNLWIQTTDTELGLFGGTNHARLRRLVLTGPLVSVTGRESVGVLAGWIQNSEVEAVLTTGQVQASFVAAGGLIGKAEDSQIRASFSSASVRGYIYTGGLVGDTRDTRLESSLATGRSRMSLNGNTAGGVAGGGWPEFVLAAPSYWSTDTTGQSLSQDSSSQGASLAQLSCSTSADDSQCAAGKVLYQGWAQVLDPSGSAYWQFGSGNQLPGLMLNGRLYRDSDGDGALDDEDAFPLVHGAVLDTDKDGTPDSWQLTCDDACIQRAGIHTDQFPFNSAASLDRDLDGLPDAWNAGCDSTCQAASGLTLDLKLKDRDNDGVADAQDPDDDNDGKPDVDIDSNGLVEIHNWAQLDAVRYQLDGRGQRLTQDGSLNSSGCPGRHWQGQWVAECIGYELKTDLNFDTNADGKLDAQDTYWHEGEGWQPLSNWAQPFSAVFAGNGHLILNLMLNRQQGNQGLFGSTQDAQIRELGMAGPLTSIQGSGDVGALVGHLFYSSVEACFVTGGQVIGNSSAGGLVGVVHNGQIRASYASTQVSVQYWAAGGLVSEVWDSELSAVYSLSRVKNGAALADANPARSIVENSYWARDLDPNTHSSSGSGISLQQLKCPVAANDQGCKANSILFKDWDQWRDNQGRAYWDFGTAQQVPVLRLNGKVYRDTDADGLFDDKDMDDDNDGVPDSQDAFPLNAAASVDDNANGSPDLWNEGCTLVCQQQSGLTLDAALPSIHSLWRHQDGSNYLLQYRGTRLLDAYPLLRVSNDWQLLGAGDFNGNGSSDLIWRHWLTGEVYLFLLSQGQIQQQISLGRVSDLDWQVKAIADVDGDKTSDLIWYHAKTGAGVSWLLQQGAVVKELNLPPLTSLDWQLIGSGDLTGDGIEDLVWRHGLSGELSLFIMSQGQLQQAKPLFSVTDSDWKLLAVADTDADNHADLIWGHKTSGLVYQFLMQGEQIKQQDSLLQLTDLSWQLAGVQDFDQDGKADLLWRNRQTGDNYLFYLDGLNIKSGQSLPAVADTAWQLGALLKP